MASHPRESRLRVDGDGVRIFEGPGVRKAVWLAALAIGLPVVATLVAIVVIRWAPASSPRGPEAVAASPARDAPARAVAEAGVAAPAKAPANPLAPPPAERARPRRVARTEPAPPPAPAGKKKPEIDARDAILALREHGETTGIAVFPLPGTDPIKRGIVVPEDFELPEGYVRHYQTTDDGTRLPAILMVHPDYELVDAHGDPVPMPADRIVPPELAPPGLAIQMLEAPEPERAPDAAP